MEERSKKTQLCVTKLKKNCQPGLTESPHHLLCTCAVPSQKNAQPDHSPAWQQSCTCPWEQGWAILTGDAFLSAAPWRWFWFSQRIQAHQWGLGLLHWTWPAALSPPRGAAPAPAGSPGSESGPWAPSARREGASTAWSQIAGLGRDSKSTGNSRPAPGAQWKALTPLFPAKQVSALKDKHLLELPDLPVRDQWFSTVRVARLQNQTVSAVSWEKRSGISTEPIFLLNTYFWKRPVHVIPLQELQIGLILYSSEAQGRSSTSGTITTVGRQHFGSQLCKIICCFLQPLCDKV